MKKNNVLIVIGSFQVGGINSSLRNFLNVITKNNNVKITLCVLYSQGPLSYYYKNYQILPFKNILKAWLGDFDKFNIKEKILYFTIKGIKKLSIKFNINIQQYIFKKVAHNQQYCGYDKVIAFAEGTTTEFASYIPAKEHIAWIHCNLKYSSYDFHKLAEIYNKYDQIYAVSQYTANVVKELFPLVENRVDYIYNIINEEVLVQDSLLSDKDLIVKTDSEIVIVSIGRLDSIKQFSQIPTIVKAISEKIKNFSWYIIGDGDKNEEDLIKQEILNNNVSDFVKMVGFKTNPAPFLKRANIYACTSKSEACPMTFLEANALNTYIVSTNFPSAVELLTDNMGMITTIEEMADTIIKCIENKSYEDVEYNDSYFLSSLDKFKSVLE